MNITELKKTKKEAPSLLYSLTMPIKGMIKKEVKEEKKKIEVQEMMHDLILTRRRLKEVEQILATSNLIPIEKGLYRQERYLLRMELSKTEKKLYRLRKFYEPVRFLDTDPKIGLADEAIYEREIFGYVNKKQAKKGKSYLGIVLSNIFTFFNILYIIITVLIITAGNLKDLSYLVIVFVNLLIGIVQEIKAKRMVDKLSLVTAPQARVIRDGKEETINIESLVLDDIILFKTGEQIFADSIVVSDEVEVNESLLTGESDNLTKKPGDMLLSGSFVTSGFCTARVDQIGDDNYIEKLSKEAKNYKKPHSEMLTSLKRALIVIAILIVPLMLITFSLGINHQWNVFFKGGEEALRLYKTGVKESTAIAVGMIPAGLFLLTTIALSVSVVRLANQKTLVQELYCIEMLARVNVLCLDKTGTITDGTMKVIETIQFGKNQNFTVKEVIGSMLNVLGTPNETSKALYNEFSKNEILKANDVLAFSSVRKYSAVEFVKQTDNGEEKVGTYFLGASEFVLTDNLKSVSQQVEKFSSKGYRVLVLGYSPRTGVLKNKPTNVVPVALLVLEDHIRETAFETLSYFKDQGVNLKVISGDDAITVSKIAQKAGVDNASRYISLEGMTEDEVRKIATEYTVFGRVTPTQKRALIAGLHDHKKVVAMTGDGVNDILALREADCSIAMASGSEAARYASHLVLLNSDFASLPKVVYEGRRVVNNIERSGALYLAKTAVTFLLTFLYFLLGVWQIYNGQIRYPFSISQLIVIEFVCIGVPTVFLSLQNSKEIIKGKFIVNVLKNSLPTAFAIFVIHTILFALVKLYFVDNNGLIRPDLYATVALLINTMIFLDLSIQVGTPFNKWKWVLYVTVISGTFIWFALCFTLPGSFLNKNTLDLTPLNKTLWPLTLIFILLGHFAVEFFHRAFNKNLKIPFRENAFDKK